MPDEFGEVKFHVKFNEEPKYGDLVLVHQKLRQLDQNEFFAGNILKCILSTIFVYFCSVFSNKNWVTKTFQFIQGIKVKAYQSF